MPVYNAPTQTLGRSKHRGLTNDTVNIVYGPVRADPDYFHAYHASYTGYEPYPRPPKDVIGPNAVNSYQQANQAVSAPHAQTRKDPQIVAVQDAPAQTIARSRPRAENTRLGSVPRGEMTFFSTGIDAFTRFTPHILTTINAATAKARSKPRTLLNLEPQMIDSYDAEYTIYQWQTRALMHTLPEISEGITGLNMSFQITSDLLSYVSPIPIVLPDPPVTPTIGVIPASGGMIVRALHGKVVDMNTPTIVDGKPT